jgi:hypothetical protein
MDRVVVVDGKVEALIAGAVEEPIADLLDVEEGYSSIPYEMILLMILRYNL